MEKLDIDTRYICFREVDGKKCQFQYDTIRIERKESIKAMLIGMTYTWDKLKKFGWKCARVDIILEFNK